nr:tetratricopeptide repeat protein [uncultured Neokomagataea sp.]
MIKDSARAEADDGLALLAEGKVEEAQHIFRTILERDSEQAEAWHGLACYARHHGNAASAVALVGRALRCARVTDEQRARYHITLGAALLARGQAEASRAAFSVARTLNACDPRALSGLAEALVALGRPQEARSVLEHAVTLAADDAPILTRLAELHLEAGALETAIICFRRAAERTPSDGRVWANLGVAFYQGSLATPSYLDEAHSALERAVALGADTAETLNTRGLVRMACGALEAARADMEAALVKAPQSSVIVNNLATLLEELGEAERAEAVYEAVMQRETGALQARSRFNRGALRLGQGRYAEGWADFEARRALVPPSVSGVPLWDGQAGMGPIEITAEQGLGDQVQFLRYLQEVVRRRPVRLRGPIAVLARYMQHVPEERILGGDGPVDACISLLSLPAVLQVAAPSSAPYLHSSSAIEPLRVGVCWAGSATYRFDRRRSVAWDCLAPLQRIAGIHLVSLQRGAQVEGLEQPMLESLDDLVREVGRCALVISVDTLVAHIAGAIGRPLWLLNRYGGDWRWRQPKAWYGSCEQVFQPHSAAPPPECWAPVMDKLVAALEQWGREKG